MHCTVLMPAYNTGAVIQEAIASVIAQTFTDWDILVVDDGSTDNTVEKVFELANGRDISVLSAPHQGCCFATKLGIQHARGPIIASVDSDDKLYSTSLETIVPEFEKDPDLGFVWTNYIAEGGRYGNNGDRPHSCSFFDALVHEKWWRAGLQRTFRKSTYEKTQGLITKWNAGVDFQLVVLLASTGCNVKHLPVALYWWRQDRNGRISKAYSHQQQCIQEIREEAKKWSHA